MVVVFYIIDNLGCLHATDEGGLQRAVEVKGQLHIIEELQLFEKPQPVNSIVISQKQVGQIKECPLQEKDILQNHKCHFKIQHCIFMLFCLVVGLPLDECICGLTLWCRAAALVHMSQIYILF